MNKQDCRSFVFLPFWNWLEILIYRTDRLSWKGGRNPSRSLFHSHFCCFYVWILCLSLLQINCDDDRCFWLVKLCELCIPFYKWYFWSCMTVEFSYQWDYSFLVALVLWCMILRAFETYFLGCLLGLWCFMSFNCFQLVVV